MAGLVKSVFAMNLAILVLQCCVLGFQIHRWNEIIGSIFGVVVCLIGYLPRVFGEGSARWFSTFYVMLLVVDFVVQLVNMILLIIFQWVIIQFCIHYNVSVDISGYGGVSCNDWWHFGYGEINYRDRALIVTILLAIVIILRLIQIIFNLILLQKEAKPGLVVTDIPANFNLKREYQMRRPG